MITPNPQLTDPAAANTVFLVMAEARLPIVANNAAAGMDPVKVINGTYAGWPMLISEYKSSATLAKARPWTAGDLPAAGDAPVSIVGLNILIEWGPTVQGKPPKLEAAQVEAMNELIKTLDPYLGPLLVRTSSPLVVPTASPSPTASSSASAKPSAKPSSKPPKPSPRPSKKPRD